MESYHFIHFLHYYPNAKTRSVSAWVQLVMSRGLKRSWKKSSRNSGSNVEALYRDFLGEPNGHLAHELLHTHYHQREIYPDSVLEK